MPHPVSPARRYYDNIVALRTGRITPDQYRAANREQRAEIGEAAYDAAKRSALTFDVRANG